MRVVYVTMYEVAELKSMYQMVMTMCKTRGAVGMMMSKMMPVKECQMMMCKLVQVMKEMVPMVVFKVYEGMVAWLMIMCKLVQVMKEMVPKVVCKVYEVMVAGLTKKMVPVMVCKVNKVAEMMNVEVWMMMCKLVPVMRCVEVYRVTDMYKVYKVAELMEE